MQLGAAMRTFANMPGSITARRATPKPTLISVWKMKWGSDIHADHLPLCDRDLGDFFVWFDCESQDSALLLRRAPALCVLKSRD